MSSISIVVQAVSEATLTIRHLYYFVGALVLYKVIHQLFLYPYLLSPLRSVPGPPIGEPIFGQSIKIFRYETGIVQREWIKKYGPVVRVVGPVGMERLMFMTPEALHHMLVKEWLDCPRPQYLRNILGLVAGYGLLTVTGNEHRQMRKVMNPAFSIPNLMAQTDMYYEPIEGKVVPSRVLSSQRYVFTSLIQVLSSQLPGPEGAVLPVYEWMSKATLDIICETAFGYHTDSLHNPHNELAEAYEKLLSLQSGPNMARLVLFVSLPGGAKFLSSNLAYKIRGMFSYIRFFAPLTPLIDSTHCIRDISKQILDQKMKETSESGVSVDDTHTKKDIMSILVRARQADLNKDRTAYAMSDAAMMDQVLTFLGAGHETTASGLTWTLWLLANDKTNQQRLRDEVRPIMAADPRPDYKTLKNMQWLDCVVMESLRVMPPVPLTVRTTAKTDYIEGVLVPKGTLLHISIRNVNTWQTIWGEDAEEFHPERWLNLPKAYNSTFSLLSFIAGPHGCIGKTMAIVEMKAVLAALITNFEFEPAYDGQQARPSAAITMKPADGMPLRIRRVT
ncbi:cytochrome P450 [Guyanagaster necrorhizus]|uniref:Cytochrome P450 n=1 Tax=Guyanagaster necrorhizus TaxID=856835 RepID=A0A9P7VQK0_9AGAR|nr:cytochrome P450 [Guyanagaster necrorhizus MCA 3950]KAG7444977.1 cytochrome P450 [Guyanagaster necrorhizus MCA 3950]